MKKNQSISAFDLDHTLFSENSSYRFGRYLYSKKLVPFSSLAFIIGCNIRYKLGLLSIVKLHQSAFGRLFHGQLSSVVKQWAIDFLDENFEKLLYLPAIEKLMSAQNAGHVTGILSSTPDFLVEPIAKRLNVSFWDATRYAVDKDSRFCHIDKLMLGSDKAIVLQELGNQYGITRHEMYAYSDSDLDLPFLFAAGHACGVNPNRKLRSICHENDWLII